MPGHFPIDEESSDLTFVFWYTLQVWITDKFYLFMHNLFLINFYKYLDTGNLERL